MAGTYCCRDCATRTRVTDSYISPGWLGTNYDEMLVVSVECPDCGASGKHRRRDDGVTTRQGCLAAPEPAADPRELVPARADD